MKTEKYGKVPVLMFENSVKLCKSVSELLLPCALVLLCLVPCALGKYSGGAGTPEDPYRIADHNDLYALADDVNDYNKCFIMTADIDLDPNLPGRRTLITALVAHDTNTSSYYFEGRKFTGKFVGDGKKIRNLRIDTAGARKDYLGLFGYIDGSAAEVDNLGIEHAVITGGDLSYYLGGLCGRNDSGTISNCWASGSVTGGDSSGFLGALCGINYYGIISNCWADGSVTGGHYSLSRGGLCGYNSGTIINCWASGSVSGGHDSLDAGGLCGRNYYGTISNCWAAGQVTGGTYSYHLGGLCGRYYYGTISNSYASGSVSGDDYLGGLCGLNRYGTISNCWASGSVSGYHVLGGLCGWNDFGTIINSSAGGSVSAGDNSSQLGGLCGDNDHGAISNCYATGSVSGDDYLGGLCGRNYDGTTTNCWASGSVTGDQYKGGVCSYYDGGSVTGCFWDTQTSGMTDGVGNVEPDPNGVQGKTTAEMKTQSIFTNAGWDFNDVWAICEATNYPRFIWQILIADFVCPDGVTFPDYSFFSTWWLRDDCAINDNCDGADIDFSGAVDITDLQVFCNYWLEGI